MSSNTLPSNNGISLDDSNVERLHNLQHKMAMLQRENENLKHLSTPEKCSLSTPSVDMTHSMLLGGQHAYNDIVSWDV